MAGPPIVNPGTSLFNFRTKAGKIALNWPLSAPLPGGIPQKAARDPSLRPGPLRFADSSTMSGCCNSGKCLCINDGDQGAAGSFSTVPPGCGVRRLEIQTSPLTFAADPFLFLSVLYVEAKTTASKTTKTVTKTLKAILDSTNTQIILKSRQGFRRRRNRTPRRALPGSPVQ